MAGEWNSINWESFPEKAFKKALKEDPVFTEMEELENLRDEEIEKRRWCIDQATSTDASSADEVIRMAKKIYEYVYGEKE